jgi:hypothetical protein
VPLAAIIYYRLCAQENDFGTRHLKRRQED